MTNKPNFYEHLLYINENLVDVVRLPFETRVKPLKKLISYYKKNLSNEEAEGVKEVLSTKERLFNELSEATHFESSYNLLFTEFSKARDLLRHDYDNFEGFGDLLEQIPCKSSEETLMRLLYDDEASIDMIVRLYLAEHNAILHPEEASKFA